MIQCAVEAIQALHDVGVKQRIEDGFYTQRERAGGEGVTERLSNHLWAEGVVVFGQLLAVVQQGQALLQGK